MSRKCLEQPELGLVGVRLLEEAASGVEQAGDLRGRPDKLRGRLLEEASGVERAGDPAQALAAEEEQRALFARRGAHELPQRREQRVPVGDDRLTDRALLVVLGGLPPHLETGTGTGTGRAWVGVGLGLGLGLRGLPLSPGRRSRGEKITWGRHALSPSLPVSPGCMARAPPGPAPARRRRAASGQAAGLMTRDGPR